MERLFYWIGLGLVAYVVFYVWRTASKNANSLLNPPPGKTYGLGSGWQ